MIILKLKIALTVAIVSIIIAGFSVYNFASNEKVLKIWNQLKVRSKSFKLNNYYVSKERNSKAASLKKDANKRAGNNRDNADTSSTKDNADRTDTLNTGSNKDTNDAQDTDNTNGTEDTQDKSNNNQDDSSEISADDSDNNEK